ncbi:MAG: M1 family metallopeptidase [Chitinophagaceae bacterium]|jgi:aminopeptidase N|nr:M1 family metallopeptidase [Chitinophagaceae bacterium]OQY94902.1 MAG: peptidase M1 [Sphingobacteriales bacterium UTBCD1]
MRKLLFTLFLLNVLTIVSAQNKQPVDTSWKKIYRAAATRINDLVHTKLDVKFDFEKSYMYGKAWITLKPHFYATDSLTLDAKGMDFHKVAIVKDKTLKDLKYDHDDMQIHITLDKTYKGGEPYTIFIDYTSKPNEVKAKGSAAITDARGLYFINPQGKEKDKPTEIWTQGETEANSVWMPTIDKPDQKTTQEIYMTVPDKYVTLSNGLLISKKKNNDGTRTDYWRMNLPNSPYLFFMGVGDFAIVKDSYKGKEVSYYVDKDYASVARKIFGHTPEMISFYSRITGVDYPWPKYSQMTGHDYVSGAMENTTATLHSDAAQQDARELTDGNAWETTIAHELFHHWFGDFVTAESWSNITLNESFADYSETLWEDYKYGKDAGDEQNYNDRLGYLSNPADAKKDLVRFYYADKEDVFDGVSYQKGGAILHMLRYYVGDSAFFKALNLYLTAHKFQPAEAQQLRLAFEAVTGRDLNWYWNQWYFGAGHPHLDINYSYDDASKKISVVVNQTQTGDYFKLPVAIDVYTGKDKKRYDIWVNDKTDTFSFQAPQKPELVNFDGDKVLLCTKKENKTLDEYIFQYKNAGKYVDRREAIDFASKHQDEPKAVAFLITALKDKYEGLRNLTIARLDTKKQNVKDAAEATLAELAKQDPVRTVKANAIAKLGSYQNPVYATIFKAAVNDSSYTVSGNALEALFEIDSVSAFHEAKRLSSAPSKGKLYVAIATILIKSGDESSASEILSSFEKMPLSQTKFNLMQLIGSFIGKTKNFDIVKRGVDAIVALRDAIPEAYRDQVSNYINGIFLKGLATKKKEAGLPDQAEYILSKIPESDR